jgi:hypothetical protein
MDQNFQEFVEGLRSEDWEETLQTWLPDDHWINLMVYAQNDIFNGGWFQHYGNQVINPDVYIEGCQKVGANKELAYALQARAKFPEGKYPIRTEEDIDPMDDQLIEMGISNEMFWDMEKTYFDDTDDMGPLVHQYAIEHAPQLWEERSQ